MKYISSLKSETMEENINIQKTFNLNDWLNTIADSSPFGEFEDSEEFRDVIDALFEDIEERFTVERLRELRESGKYTEKVLQAIEDLYNKIVTIEDFHLEYRLPSPKYQNRYWIFKNDEFRVAQVTMYEVPELFKLYAITEHEGDLDNYPDVFPEQDYYLDGNPRVIQKNTHDQEVITWEEWEALREYDENAQYIKSPDERPNRQGFEQACRQYKHQHHHMPAICYKVEGADRRLRAHMIAWPIVLIVTMAIIMIARLVNRRQCVSRTNSETNKPATLPGKDLPPNYEFVIQFPPEYSEATKDEEPPSIENVTNENTTDPNDDKTVRL